MSIYLVLSSADKPDLGSHIAAVFPDESRQISPSQWLVSANTTAQGVGKLLGVDEGKYGRVMISLVTAYWGWHDKDLWSWIALKEGK